MNHDATPDNHREGLAGTAICPTVLGLVPAVAASPTTAKLDLTMTATYACPFLARGQVGCGSPVPPTPA